MATNAVVKGEKKGFFRRTKDYVKGTWSELKKVHWPNKKQIVNYTLVVLAAVLIMAVVLWVFDSVFSLLVGGLFNLFA